MLFLLCFLVTSSTAFASDVCNDADTTLAPFKIWTLSDATLPVPTREIDAVYDESFDSNSIYMIGGHQCSNCAVYGVIIYQTIQLKYMII